MVIALQIATIILSVLMVILIMLQVRGDALGSVLGAEGGAGLARTRRGLERLLFRITVGVSIIFLVVCILSASVFSAV